jgi:N-formylglutamate deformylase
VDPFTIHRPPTSSPLLYDSPHSGRFYPPNFASHATRLELRRGEDAYVDELLAGAPALGATVLAANYPRCYIDLNRADDDIDAALLAEPWPGPLHPTEKTARGLGLIRRYVVPGVEAQAGPLSVRDVQSRIERVYRPYHAALSSLAEETHSAHGAVLHIDWHSMKSVGNAMTPDGAGAHRPDFVVSDRNGTSASSVMTDLVVTALRDLLYTVTVNDPYRGGEIVRRIGFPARNIHSIQVEINRRRYLDENAVATTDAAAQLMSNLEQLTRVLVDALAHLSRVRF